MLCPPCSALPPRIRGQPAPGPALADGHGRLRELLCARCGHALAPAAPPGAATERMGLLRRLGLAEGGGPLLHPVG